MENPRPPLTSYGLFGGTLLLFLVLLLLPATHWISSLQSRMLVNTPGEYAIILNDLGVKETPYRGNPKAMERARKEVVEREVNDYDIQLASACAFQASNTVTGEASSTARIAPFRALKERF